MTEHRWDKHVTNDADFEASDDEDMASANGATRRNGNKRTFTDFRKGEADVEAETTTPRSRKEGDADKEPAEEETHDINDDTIEDVGATEEADQFQIGKRNLLMLRKLLWKNNVLLHAHDTGGLQTSRTVVVDVATGALTIRSQGIETQL